MAQAQKGNTPSSVLIFIIIASVLSLAGWKYYTTINSIAWQPVDNESKVYFNSPVLNSLYQKALPLKKSPNNLVKKSDNVWWVSPDNYSINVPDAESLIFTAEFPNDGQAEHQDDLISGYILKSPAMKSFYDLTVKTLLENGFKKNNKNSLPSYDDKAVGLFGYYEGYEKENSVCTVTISINPHRPYSDNGPVYYPVETSCTNKYPQAYIDQKPFLEALNLRDAIISSQKQSGNYYLLNINYRVTGHYAVVKKEGEKVVVIIEGSQDTQQLCDLINGGKLPKELEDSCTNSDTPKI